MDGQLPVKEEEEKVAPYSSVCISELLHVFPCTTGYYMAKYVEEFQLKEDQTNDRSKK
jgi:hypothetical protein